MRNAQSENARWRGAKRKSVIAMTGADTVVGEASEVIGITRSEEAGEVAGVDVGAETIDKPMCWSGPLLTRAWVHKKIENRLLLGCLRSSGDSSIEALSWIRQTRF
jgi:hypothetical protein